MPGDDSKPAYLHDVFISYSRKDREFANLLHIALEAYNAPRSLGVRNGNLRVFRDEADFTGADYQEFLSRHLADSAKLVVVCSPNIYGVSRAEIEDREKKRQARTRRITAGVVGSIIVALSVALVITLISRKEAAVQRGIAQEERTNALMERDRARTAAEAEKKARVAEEQQRRIADERRIEADRQRGIAAERANIALSRQLAAQALMQVNEQSREASALYATLRSTAQTPAHVS